MCSGSQQGGSNRCHAGLQECLQSSMTLHPVVQAWTYLTAAAWMGVTAVATVPFSDWTLPQRVHGPLVYWIFVSSIAGYSIMTLATRYLPASQVSAFVCLQPFIGTLLAIVKLGEKVCSPLSCLRPAQVPGMLAAHVSLAQYGPMS